MPTFFLIFFLSKFILVFFFHGISLNFHLNNHSNILGMSQVNCFDICAAGETYTAIKLVKNPGCSGCTNYLLCVGFLNAVTKCSLTQTDAVATARLISANNGNGGFSNYMSLYLGATYNSAAVSSGLNGDDCSSLYGSTKTCFIPGSEPLFPNPVSTPCRLPVSSLG